MTRRVAALVLLAALAVPALPTAASAHAVLRSSVPANGESRSNAPRTVTLTFSEAPDLRGSEVRVLGTAGQDHAGALARVGGDPLSVRVPVRGAERGVYTVSWRVLSRVDGHVTAGAFAFGVGVSPDEIGAVEVPDAQTPPVSPLEVAGRFGLYAGVALLVGAALTAASPRRLVQLGIAAWLVAAGGLVALGTAQLDAAGGLRTFMGTRSGQMIGARLACLLVVLVALPLHDRVRAPRLRSGVMLAGSGGVILAHVFAGHAAAKGLVWLKVATQWTHAAAISVWLGGLAALVVVIVGADPATRSAAARRFSTAAGVAIAVVAGTGTARAVNEVGSVGALFDTGYGRIVCTKIVLFLALAALGAWNRYRSVPRARAEIRSLRRVSRAELAIGAVVLALTGLLSSVAPPDPAVRAEEAERVSASGTDFARTVRVALEVSPGLPGANRFAADVTAPSSGEPVDATGVSLRFAPFGGDVSESTLRLRRSGDRWTGRGAHLAVAGPWRAIALVERGAGSVEVELRLHTRCAVRDLGGEPPLYAAPLGDGREVQTYVDPGRAGANQIHFTFFTSDGDELPVRRDAAITAMRAGAEPQDVTVRRFGPGHFVGETELARGRWFFDLRVALDDGETVQTCFEEEIER